MMIRWTRGEALGKGGFGFVSIAKTHQSESSLIPPLIAVKSAKDDITTENGEKLYNILLEYASGGCLADRIVPKKGMPEMIVSRCTKSILTALVHIHKLGYIHCDVKPHNVLLSERGDAKLADFGSCVSIDDGKSCDFRGTVVYAAPESIARQKFVPESDIWALGCSVLQMLTGKSPWVFDKRTEVKDALFRIGCSGDIPEIPTNNKISKEAKDFLRKCLVKDPTARWKADMLIDHPFVQKADHHHLTAGSGSDCSTQRHVSSRLSHLGIHSIVPHCFHVPKVQAC
ncbi:mitogen-activated protein kinase kinase kinase npk1 [Phtheirospermum japonicum]|uniref:Mitogen-activated protein kinase kinase kinase npk1 n=1 Tax=Phtheirospermum japonicum TaxID=374723 RepID=A0A830DAA9_9LAMI|nr:mitogen-activated protein kinase kinase kinase npk1 [Phtheirospermum japonicum]